MPEQQLIEANVCLLDHFLRMMLDKFFNFCMKIAFDCFVANHLVKSLTHKRLNKATPSRATSSLINDFKQVSFFKGRDCIVYTFVVISILR